MSIITVELTSADLPIVSDIFRDDREFSISSDDYEMSLDLGGRKTCIISIKSKKQGIKLSVFPAHSAMKKLCEFYLSRSNLCE